jgi:hypothetical protein
MRRKRIPRQQVHVLGNPPRRPSYGSSAYPSQRSVWGNIPFPAYLQIRVKTKNKFAFISLFLNVLLICFVFCFLQIPRLTLACGAMAITSLSNLSFPKIIGNLVDNFSREGKGNACMQSQTTLQMCVHAFIHAYMHTYRNEFFDSKICAVMYRYVRGRCTWNVAQDIP